MVRTIILIRDIYFLMATILILNKAVAIEMGEHFISTTFYLKGIYSIILAMILLLGVSDPDLYFPTT